MDDLRNTILDLTRAYGRGAFERSTQFTPGETPVPVSGKVLDDSDIVNLVEASLDGWLTGGRWQKEFEKQLARFVGVRNAVFVNSGSSANLLALSALTSPKLGRKALKAGDEVITVAAGFPTTVNPIVQNGLRPVFVDVDLGTYDVNVEQLNAAIGPRTRAIMLAHTLGNPIDLDPILKACEDHGLWLVEDSCDALGSTYKGKKTGSFGDTATVSFYPAHHITTGEGGAVFVNSPIVRKQVESFRDWGRDCYCETGHDNTCKKRFSWKLGDLPEGYDHMYTYSHVGYNVKATDLQAALGVSQMEKVDDFISTRKRNYSLLHSLIGKSGAFIMPEATPGSDPSWFGFPLTLEDGVGFTRRELIDFLDSRKIGTRLLFGGNLTKQPAYKGVDFVVKSNLKNTDIIMNRTFWLGVYPGLTPEMLEFVSRSVNEFVEKYG